MVVMPTLLTTREEIEEQIERLEVHYLANQDGDLYFALLSDWTDSATESTEADDGLFGVAVEGIARLNKRHESACGRRQVPPSSSTPAVECTEKESGWGGSASAGSSTN